MLVHQQKRPQRCYRDRPHHADRLVSVRALLASRASLVKIKRDLENHVRGLLKNLGLVIGRAKFNVFAVRAEELIAGRPELIAAIKPLLEARNAVERQVSELARARNCGTGLGPLNSPSLHWIFRLRGAKR